MSEKKLYICPLLNKVIEANGITKNQIVNKTGWSAKKVKGFLCDPHKISYFDMCTLVDVLNELKPDYLPKIKIKDLDRYFEQRHDYIIRHGAESDYDYKIFRLLLKDDDSELEQLKKAQVRLKENIKKRIGAYLKKHTEIDFLSHSYLKDYISAETRGDSNTELYLKKFVAKATKDYAKLKKDIEWYLSRKDYVNEKIEDCINDNSKIDLFRIVQIAEYFDVYNCIDDFTARIAYCYAFMDEDSKVKMRQKPLKITAIPSEYKLAQIAIYRDAVKSDKVVETVEDIIEGNGYVDTEITEELLKQIYSKVHKQSLDLSQFNNMYFETAEPEIIDEEPKWDFNSSDDNDIDFDNAQNFIWKMIFLSSEDCEYSDIWDLIVKCSMLDYSNLIKYLNYAEKLFEKYCVSEDAKRAYRWR